MFNHLARYFQHPIRTACHTLTRFPGSELQLNIMQRRHTNIPKSIKFPEKCEGRKWCSQISKYTCCSSLPYWMCFEEETYLCDKLKCLAEARCMEMLKSKDKNDSNEVSKSGSFR